MFLQQIGKIVRIETEGIGGISELAGFVVFFDVAQ